MIRSMKFKDIEQIKEIDKLCFKAETKRRTAGIEGYIESSNNASIVCELDNKIVGYNFIHLWGTFGWFGPFGVHPDYQKEGIGKALIEHTVESLKRDYKVSTIGLITMPESSYNVGFYMNMGFTPLNLTLGLKKDIDNLDFSPILNNYSVNEVNIKSHIDYLNLKDNLKAISGKVFKGFDLNSELYLIKNKDFGTVFELKDNNVVHGIAICNYLISKHNFKIYHNLVMLLMGNDNPFDSKSTLMFTRFGG